MCLTYAVCNSAISVIVKKPMQQVISRFIKGE